MSEKYNGNKARVLEIYNYECANVEECGNDDVSIHHIIFRREGGGDDKANLSVLCEECQHELHTKVDKMEGYEGPSRKERKRKVIFRRKKSKGKERRAKKSRRRR